jgi:hypothetical protein
MLRITTTPKPRPFQATQKRTGASDILLQAHILFSRVAKLPFQFAHSLNSEEQIIDERRATGDASAFPCHCFALRIIVVFSISD